MIFKLFQLLFWMLLIPMGLGLGLHVSETKYEYRSDFGYDLCSGYLIMWMLFQLICVPFILLGGEFRGVELMFELLAFGGAAAGILGTLRVLFVENEGKSGSLYGKEKEFVLREHILWLKARAGILLSRAKMRIIPYFTGTDKKGYWSVLSWSVFGLTLLYQLFMSYHLAYADGDDAYYISLSTATNLGGTMYQKDAYTGAQTTLDMRHSLSPFPMWISFVAARMGVNVAVAAHTWMPLLLIPLSYLVYLEIGKELLEEKKTLVGGFMVLISLLQIWGNYSIYPASTFLLTRTRQGKAAFGNVILPCTILLLLKLARHLRETEGPVQRAETVVKEREVRHKTLSGRLWREFVFLSFAGCLCSIMSAFLLPLLIGSAALMLAVYFRRPGVLIGGILVCVPGLVYALLYAVMR